MCRWAAYVGPSIFIEEVVTRPGHSLISQSVCASEAKTETNGDGFGLAWYGEHSEPGVYRETHPAWSDPNLINLARQVKSPLFLAHVRASTGSATSRNNCHPFVYKNWSFMHNGQIGGYDKLRKRVDQVIPDELYAHRKGATDSEAMFLIAIGNGLLENPKKAIEATIYQLETMSRELGDAPYMRFAASFSDGKRLYTARYASDKFAPTVYYRKSRSLGGYAVVSEPLEVGQENWSVLPAGTFMEIEEDQVIISDMLPNRCG
ncbi:class II glutamine amidotransferase [Rhodobacterales bacterium 52_120_T64]|nr:class II glutamine amidotransferase [Rhodobacterales bacterium 52_120_T64]